MTNLLQQAINVASGPLNSLTAEHYFLYLAKSLCQIISADYVFICELDAKQKQAKTLAAVNKNNELDHFNYALTGTPCCDLVEQGVCFIKSSVADRYPSDDLLRDFGAQAYLGVALRDHSGTVIGLLTALFSSPIASEGYLLQVFQLFTGRTAAELERNRYEQQLTQKVDQLNKQSDSLVVASQVYEYMSDGIIITDRQHNIVYINPAMESISGYDSEEVLGKNPRIFASGLQSRKFFQDLWSSLSDTGVWQGEFKNRRKNGEIYTVHSNMTVLLDINGHIKNHIAVNKDLSSEKEARDLIEYQNRHDQLTGLMNRYELNGVIDSTLNRATQDSGQWAFILIDLDDFKEINDSRGHIIGDQVISAVSNRLKATLRGAGILARLGGDEFALFAPIADDNQINTLLSKINEAFRFPFILVDASQYSVTASIGLSFYPADADKSDTLYSHADQALYRAKSLGKNSHVFFTQDLADRSRRQQQVRTRLQKAVAEKKIEAYYQPIVDLSCGEITYCEALARWNDRELGAVFPGEFIPIAESYGLMPALGLCIAEQAIANIAELNNRLVTPIGVSINRSPREFIACEREPLLELAIQYKLPVNLIAIEITESLMVNDPDKAEKQLVALRTAGFKLAMDDFGTGYSSLAYLKKFPFHVLKIDRAFIKDIDTSKEAYILVKTIIEMAKNFQMKTVAEGIETEQQLNLLKKLGCEYGQGFYLSRPMTIENLTDRLLLQEQQQARADKQRKEQQQSRLSRIIKHNSVLRGSEF